MYRLGFHREGGKPGILPPTIYYHPNLQPLLAIHKDNCRTIVTFCGHLWVGVCPFFIVITPHAQHLTPTPIAKFIDTTNWLFIAE